MTTTNETRRKVMEMAWELFRAEKDGPSPRTFADALAGAWRFIKRLANWKAPAWMKPRNGHLVLKSPVAPSATARRYGSAAYTGGRSSVAYVNARLGY